ncbi:MAG: GHKL domain-containing protein [Bacteroidetes bacterium]|nr:GHKL domain-containing protein [Bacteroidota bacterium]MBU1483291.1 GHKL domain-containing protein [Bacteroidota bacterium]MBU2047168.1 GHKL domain-containing protein [Bacteroidota bacterium]MBU2268252.1 GHKL domain-containing protein [Bacteroidota bacterium]MBU2374704.1 GHKL domain-containing protein [Bacteroidota bacterium]
MKTNTKIRWLLLIVTIGLFATSLTARWASTKLVDLNDIADQISKNLGEKETQVYDYLTDQRKLHNLKNIPFNADLADNVINYFNEEHIYLQIFKKDKLVFWSDNEVTASNFSSLKEGTSFINYQTGWYEVIKKQEGDFSFIFLILVQSQYPYQNKYLDNNFNNDFIVNKSIQIASLKDIKVADIKNIEGKYLFSIKRNPNNFNMPYSNIEIGMWILGFLTFSLLINSICKFYADKGYHIGAIALLSICFVLLRYLGLKYHFPDAIYSLELFKPNIYASNFYFPSFADLFLNIITILWIVIFIYSYKNKIFKPIQNPWLGYPILIYLGVFIIFISYAYSNVFFGLIFNSNVNFKVSNLVNLNWLSVFGILMMMLGLLSFYIIVDILISLSFYIKIEIKTKLILFGGCFLFYSIYEIFQGNFTVFFILIFALILIIGRLIYNHNGQMIFPALLIVSLIFATLVSIKLTRFDNIKELEIRKRLVLRLETVDDPYAIVSFYEIERNIPEDPNLKSIFKQGSPNIKKIINEFNSNYLGGYLNKFSCNTYIFNDKDSLINKHTNTQLIFFKKRVEKGSIKVSNYFYRLNNSFGSQDYFALIPIKDNGINLGTVVLDLTSKQLETYGAFPQLLQNGKKDSQIDFADYSYAFYENKKLVNQYGNYVYDLKNNDFKGKLKDFVILKKNGFDHLIFKPSSKNTIVVTHESSTFWRELASLSFFFIIFLIFALLIVSYKWLWSVISSYELNIRSLRLKFFLSNNKLLYKTRIQVALVLAVVSSLLIIGIITFSYISIQYKDQQKDLIKGKIKVIASAFEENISNEFNSINGDEKNISFDEFSKMYGTDLNLYNKDGKLLYSTQYKIYAIGLIAERMNAQAYINLHLKQKSEFIQEENIGDLKFTSAYMPVKNVENNVIAYLQLPYFSNQDDYNQKIGTFLNLLINIYVLVFVAIGFFAFVVANQITSPLSLIQDSIAKTMMGKKNKPIEWKRNDEIGSLIKEYNSMIETLEENANKLAQSEREIAWREMAKQVAHEIKNPLTPLKLGIQMLERSWKEKDEKFDEKFRKFSKSFLEQIDSLSHIASEFSNFAKMPALKLEEIELADVLGQAIQVYGQMDHVQINWKEKDLKNIFIKVDKDQLLRSFNNLLKNAIEAMPEGRDGIIKIDGHKSSKKIEITIHDNGNGIPEELRSSIFEPNFTTKTSGTGLGLAFVKQAIENVGGNIYFTTKINVGTTFHIILPLVNKWSKES